MTCIIGLEQEGVVYVGADSAAATRSLDIRQTLVPKVFNNHNVIIGYTSSFRMGQLLQFMKIPKYDIVDEKYMVTKFVPAIRELFKEGGYSRIENNEEEAGEFIVGVKGNIYQIYSNFQVQRYADGVASCGCGEEYAYGAMRALEHLDPIDRITKSLEIASYYSGGVMAPFTVLKTK